MKKVMSLMFISALSLAVLLAGCGSREEAETERTESSLTAPVETLTSPVQTTESEFNEEENSRMQMNVQIGGSPWPHGNTAAMVAAFTKGAQEKGHAVFGLAFPSGCEVNDGAEQFLPYT